MRPGGTAWVWFAVFVLIVVAPMGTMLVRNAGAVRAIAAARTSYQAALAALHAHPNNATLRQQALTAGRAFAQLTQQHAGGAVYTEEMVLRDLAIVMLGLNEAPGEQQRMVGE